MYLIMWKFVQFQTFAHQSTVWHIIDGHNVSFQCHTAAPREPSGLISRALQKLVIIIIKMKNTMNLKNWQINNLLFLVLLLPIYVRRMQLLFKLKWSWDMKQIHLKVKIHEVDITDFPLEISRHEQDISNYQLDFVIPYVIEYFPIWMGSLLQAIARFTVLFAKCVLLHQCLVFTECSWSGYNWFSS